MSAVVNGAYVDFPNEDDVGTGTTINVHDVPANQSPSLNTFTKLGNHRRISSGLKNRFNTISSHLPFRNNNSQEGSISVHSWRTSGNDTLAGASSNNTLVRSTQREQQLEKELRSTTQKCIELQMLLNEEKSTVYMFVNKSSNFNNKKLAQELVTLKKERDGTMHHAKAALWKLQEVSFHLLFCCKFAPTTGSNFLFAPSMYL
jgi:hypothetical protein